MRWLDGITDLMDVNLSELREMVLDREAWRAVIHGVAKGRTRLSHSTTTRDYALCIKNLVCPIKMLRLAPEDNYHLLDDIRIDI